MKKLICFMLCLSFTLPVFGAINVTTNGKNRTITLSYTAPTAQINSTLSNAAEWFYTKRTIVYVDEFGDPKPFEELTNVQMLNLINKGVLDFLRHCAYSTIVNKAIEASKEAVENDDTIIPSE